MKRLTLLVTALLATAVSAHAVDYNPKANPAAEVVSGNARFTVLTDRLIRMEWAADGQFEDRASLAIVNRNLPVPGFKATQKGESLVIKTDNLTLTYSGGRFDRNNLSVSFKLKGKTVTWHPGDAADGNLKGTIRTLDGCLGYSQLSYSDNKMEDGILSRDGWAIVDESSRHLLQADGSDWGEWVREHAIFFPPCILTSYYKPSGTNNYFCIKVAYDTPNEPDYARSIAAFPFVYVDGYWCLCFE